MAQSSKVARIYRAREILLEHLAVQQGYPVDAGLHKTITEIHNGIAEPKTLNFKVTLADATTTTKVVYALMKDKLDTSELEVIYDTHFEEEDDEPKKDNNYTIVGDDTAVKPDQLIILTTDEPNATVEAFLRTKWQKRHFMVVISLQRLQFNIMKHVLVPPHQRLSAEEAALVRAKYNILPEADKQFPEISRFSPVAQVIGLRPGEVTRILRPSKTAIQSVFYRLCSN